MKVVVIGAGAIGKSISVSLALSGCEVILVTRRGKQGLLDLHRFIEKVVARHPLGKSKTELLSNIAVFSKFNFPLDVDLVIEAVKENLEEKQELFAKIDKNFSNQVILSSTTSSLSISEISKFMIWRDRMIGLHFFNPPYVLSLVEVIPGEKTSKETIKKAQRILSQLGKNPIVIPDQPGFLVNRLLFSMINEAVMVLGEGKVSAEDIDRAMKLGANHPMGPLHLADLVGLDICLTILENLYIKTKNEKYKPHQLLIEKVRNNNLGRKTGRGFFDY